MKEIEVKAKVENFEAVIKNLENLGCVFSEPIRQEDVIFSNPKFPFNRSHLEALFLRIRNQNGKFIFTVKQSVTNELDSIEHETEIGDKEEMEATIKLLGYEKTVEVKKMRRKAKYRDYEVCLDEVEGLGDFIEVERMVDGDGEAIQKEMFDFLKSLGVREEDRVFRGYDSLVYATMNNSPL